MSFSLPELPYAHDALAPYMSRETLEYHHDKHHLAYVNNCNDLAKGTEWENKPVEEVVKGTVRQETGTVQQCRTTLQPHSLLEMDEAGRWRRQDPRRARKKDHRRSWLHR
jgi:superoxide dismutase